ncbi:hypothetical protein DGWBC_1141 [Dehalogenimonas sp. WBC-2]|nr:hypothetical protein DGWBC_1141 [Dehalogenimonas sp. WBC-2]
MNWWLVFFAIDLVFGILITVWISQQANKWSQSQRKEEKDLLSAAIPSDARFQPRDTSHLPAPVQRYLNKSIKEGTPYISTARLRQSGKFRFNNRWIKFNASQYYSVEPPAFNWTAKMKLGPAWITARDRYINGKGNMLIKILSALPLFDVSGKEMDHASLVRHFSELPWLPTALLSNNIQWQAIDDRSAKAILSDGKLAVACTFHFNEKDEIDGFVTPSRFRSDTGKMTPWSGTFGNYQDFGNVRIPTTGSAAWNTPEGNFEYININIENAEFNTPASDCFAALQWNHHHIVVVSL